MKIGELPDEVRIKLFPYPSHGLVCFEPAKKILDMYNKNGGTVADLYHVNCGNCEHFDASKSKVHDDPCKNK